MQIQESCESRTLFISNKQSKLAELTENKQQAISRTENKGHTPSLKMFL